MHNIAYGCIPDTRCIVCAAQRQCCTPLAIREICLPSLHSLRGLLLLPCAIDLMQGTTAHQAVVQEVAAEAGAVGSDTADAEEDAQ
jgi:hypothetical protein